MTFLYKDEPYLNAIINSSNVPFLEGETVTQNVFAVSLGFISDDVNLWHHRLGHLSYDRLRQLQKLAENEKIRGIPSKLPPHDSRICQFCLAGKHHRSPFNAVAWRASEPLELIHSDLKGPLPPTRSGFKYWISFTDDYSRYRKVYFLAAKSQAFDAFQQYNQWAKNQLGTNIKMLRDDKGGEYMSKEFDDYCKSEGIER